MDLTALDEADKAILNQKENRLVALQLLAFGDGDVLVTMARFILIENFILSHSTRDAWHI